jgi:hypothetical protein
MDFLKEAAPAPRQRTDDGRKRRVGVEIEFAAVTARDGARIVQDLFGGVIREEDAHRYHVEGTDLGTFTSELDTQYAHRPHGLDEADETGALAGFRAEMRRLLGDISSLVMPCEIVCPPIDHSDLPRLDGLVAALNAAGAEGTRASPFYAFGVQLNPEIATASPDWLAGVLRAYLLVSPWLRAAMALDITRRAVAFADPFPRAYAQDVLRAGYAPDLPQLIDDYLRHNPTRNRELDLLPLFAHLDPDRVRTRVDDPRVSARPAFHYRLPDANLGQSDWSVCLEWNRWLVVERLAENAGLLERIAADYSAHDVLGGLRDWPLRCSQWLILSGEPVR